MIGIIYLFYINVYNIYIFRINNSINQLVNLDFSEYPIPNNKDINSHLKIINVLISLYKNSVNSFELNDIDNIFNKLFNHLFEGYDKIIIPASKMEVESQLIQ